MKIKMAVFSLCLAMTVASPIHKASATSCSTNTATVNMSLRDQWQWFQNDSSFPMTCLSGSMTGFGYYVPSSWNGNVAFVFDGGGMCYDAESCSHVGMPNVASVAAQIVSDTKPTSSGAPFMARDSYSCTVDFANDLTNNKSDVNGMNWSKSVLYRGVFDHASAVNPFKNYMTVFVPYCTGDMHVGNRVDNSAGVAGRVPSNKTFHGLLDTYYTLSLALSAATAAAPNSGHQPKKIVLAGGSAGGWGALYSYGLLRNGIVGPPSNGAQVIVIDDGGMPLPSGTSTDKLHWTQMGYLQLEGPNSGQPRSPVSSFEEWQYDAWGGSQWAQWFGSTALTSAKPLGDNYAFVSSQAASLYAISLASTPGSVGYGDKFAFIDGSSDWLYWYLTPTLWMNDDPLPWFHTPSIGTAQSQMVSSGLTGFFPVVNTQIAGFAQWYKHHVFIEDDVSTWDSSGSNILAAFKTLPL